MDLPEEIRTKLAELDLELSEGESAVVIALGNWKRIKEKVPGIIFINTTSNRTGSCTQFPLESVQDFSCFPAPQYSCCSPYCMAFDYERSQ